MYISQDERPSGEASFAAVMNKAADLIGERGLKQGYFYENVVSPKDGGLCTWAAVHEAATGELVPIYTDKSHPYHSRLEKWLSNTLGCLICFYNNTHNKGDVVSMLRRAAKEA